MKRLSLLVALLLALGLLAGCGGDDSSSADDGSADAPAGASVEDFCGAFLDLAQKVQAGGADMSDADQVKLAKDLAAQLKKVGTPDDMPADARRAFELAISKIEDLPDDATSDDMSSSADKLTDEQQADQDALTSYLTTTCASVLQPSASPSS